MTSLFHTTSKHIVKTIGWKSLHPVTDLNTAERFKPFCFLKKKKSFWFWKEPRLIPTQITLGDILQQKTELPSTANTFTILENCVDKPTFKVDGKVGAEIAKELQLELSATDSVTVTMLIGDIVKTEIGLEVVNEFLQKRPANLSHEIFQEVRMSRRTTLCVVSETLSTKFDSNLSEDDHMKVQTDDSIPINKSIVQVSIQADGTVEKTASHSFTLPQGTVLAYGCNEISVDQNGIISLHASLDRLDDSDKPLFIQKSNVDDPVIVVRNRLAPLLKAEYFERFQYELKLLLEDMTEESLQAMHLLLSTAALNSENKTEDRSMSLSMLHYLFGDDSKKSWEDLLLTLGFVIPVHSGNDNAQIEYPTNDFCQFLKPCLGIIDALIDIPPDIRVLLANISSPHAKILANIVERQLHGEDVARNETAINSMFMKDPSTELFLKAIGFIEVQADENELICHAGATTLMLMDVLVVLYVISDA